VIFFRFSEFFWESGDFCREACGSTAHNPYCCSHLSPMCMLHMLICTHLTLYPLLAHHHLCYAVDCYVYDFICFIFIILFNWIVMGLFCLCLPWSPFICYFWLWVGLLAFLWIYSFPLSVCIQIFCLTSVPHTSCSNIQFCLISSSMSSLKVIVWNWSWK